MPVGEHFSPKNSNFLDTREKQMPADAWAAVLPVGGQSRSQVGRASRVRDNSTQHMTGQNSGRIDDTVLVREAQRGNRAAFEDLVRHYDQAVLRLAMHLTGSDHEAQDIYQEAFLKAYKVWGASALSVRFIPGFTASSPICVWIICASGGCGKKTLLWQWMPKGRPTTCLTRLADGRAGAKS